MKRIVLFSLALLFAFALQANITLPRIFGDNMVLQRNQPIPVWGWANAKESITVTFNKQVKTIKAGKDGKWMVRLDPEQAGGPFQLLVKGKNSISISNVLVGEVWICSGQSNMEMPIAGWGKINNYEQEIADASYPDIRHFLVPKTVGTKPQADIPSGDWKVCSPQTAGDFTAAGYFFARALYSKLHVPIGLINTSWGGTNVETWISRGAFEKSDEFKSMIGSMPVGDLGAATKDRKEKMVKKIGELQGVLPTAAAAEHWKEPAFDDSHWPHMSLPGVWEQQGMGLEDLDGIVWFRKTVIVAAEDAGKTGLLELAKIDDSDDTYVNGVKVGEAKNKYGDKRSYIIPAGVLVAGKNTIAVRVEDTGGGGGIYGEAADMKFTVNNKSQALAGEWAFSVASILQGNAGVNPNNYPTLLFNAMINPLIPYAFKGVIWYQGESNAGRAYQYQQSFPLMITDWRQHWGAGDFPFLFVELSSFNSGNGNSANGSTWAELREAQTMTLSLPNTGMAVTTDIGNATDIHPKNKQDVGKRLAAIALNNVYGQMMEYSGPSYQSMKTDGDKIILSFAHVGGGLLAKDKYGYLKGFEIAGADQQFHYAKAMIEGDQVIIFQQGVADPVAVRYGWADDAGESNLFNKEGFPALPFRTDKWKGITEGGKYTITR